MVEATLFVMALTGLIMAATRWLLLWRNRRY
jgi:hypothetical protein